MDLAELSQLMSKLPVSSKVALPAAITGLLILRRLFRRVTGTSARQSSLHVQKGESNIKFKGPALLAGLIILLSYLKKETK